MSVSGGGRPVGLVGRGSERAALGRLADGLRGGGSRALVVAGEPGTGKTALLEDLAERVPDCRVLRASGVQSEMELAFAGLHQLCAPLLDLLEAIPPPQAAALRTTFGLSAGPVPDQLLVGLGVLSLLAEAAADRPLLCLVDDEQWLDRASAQALGFVARRLGAESVGLVFGTRAVSDELQRLPRLTVEGLGTEEACALLDSALTVTVDQRVRDQIVAETHGNPLALVEIPRDLAAAHLAGGFGLVAAMAVPKSAEDMFRRRIEALPVDSRTLLLVAAAEPTGDPVLLWRGAERLGLSALAAGPAVDAGLIELRARVRFRHPLVRSAVYRTATAARRRLAHGALAAVTDPAADPDRRAWHRAQAAEHADEAVAEDLERSDALPISFLQRAALLTPDPGRRTRRALAAAQAKLSAGDFDTAQEVLALAEAGPLGESERARVALVRARLAFATSRGSEVPPLLLRAARRLEPVDAALARMTYLDAIRAAVYVGRFAGPGADLPSVADAVESAALAPDGSGEADRLLDALAAGFPRAGLPVPRFITALRGLGDPGGTLEGEARRLSMTAFAASGVWDYDRWEMLIGRYVDLCRRHGALTELRLALTARSIQLLVAGELVAADSAVEELRAAVAATGGTLAPYGAVASAAFRGHEATASALIETAVEDAERRGEGLAVTVAEWAGAVLGNGLGHYQRALAAGRRAVAYPHEDLGLRNWALAETVEAAVRSGDLRAATTACRLLAETTRGSGTDWALGVQARCGALLASGGRADDLYRESIARLGRTRVRAELARAHLLYGEWLRRERRRADARTQLRAAHELFDAMGMAAFAERAGRELWATGQTPRRPGGDRAGELTAQETQVAKLARDGLTNPEIGTRLFISARTVEYHLSKVFTKLGITSRTQLDRVLPQPAPGPPSGRPRCPVVPVADRGAGPGTP
ncbi:ATP-binding protein [Streptomyces sp. LaBMicrA B280]|uniref:ATP-binding protein n=1 Tax=Streptomyces sp. LaBMicrA B280 TaxID=3391001 RepID=UPI003BA5AF60